MYKIKKIQILLIFIPIFFTLKMFIYYSEIVVYQKPSFAYFLKWFSISMLTLIVLSITTTIFIGLKKVAPTFFLALLTYFIGYLLLKQLVIKKWQHEYNDKEFKNPIMHTRAFISTNAPANLTVLTQ